jgi:hypothetical protein
MDDRVKRLHTPDECEIFARNAEDKGRADLAAQARRRRVELQAQSSGAHSAAEREALQAVYAYEEVLSQKNGKRTRATRTWQMIQRHGIIEAVERAVNRSVETQGYRALIEMGMEDLAFEAVVSKYPDLFSDKAVEVSRERLKAWKDTN